MRRRFGTARILIYFVLVCAVGVALVVWAAPRIFSSPFLSRDITLSTLERKAIEIVELAREVSAPPPLREEDTGGEGSRRGVLTALGIIQETNAERTERGLGPLLENSLLVAAAEQKIRDMFGEGYFAHVSPDGVGPSELVDETGYGYLLVGENLAMGNFTDDDDVVAAWMDSKGHRENILNDRYEEIGVAAEEGVYEGDRVWIAVQTFALPSSVCPLPEDALRDRVSGEESALHALEAELEAERRDIEGQYPPDPHEADDYNARVRSYNQRAEELNMRARALEKAVAEYNAEVRVFNTCVESYAGS